MGRKSEHVAVCFRYIKLVVSALIYKEKRFIITVLHYKNFNQPDFWSVLII